MANLKQIDEDILKKIKQVHENCRRMLGEAKMLFRGGVISDPDMSTFSGIFRDIEGDLRAIYKDVMEEEAVAAHLKKLNEQMEKEFD